MYSILKDEIKYLNGIGIDCKPIKEKFILEYKGIKTEIIREQYYVTRHIKDYWYMRPIRKKQ